MHRKEYTEQFIVAANQYKKEKDYWMKKLTGDLSFSYFPYDHNKKEGCGGHTESVNFKITGKLFTRLIKIITVSDVRLNIILVAAIITLIEKYTGSKDIIVGSPIYRQEMEANFTNTVLALRNLLEDNITFKKLILQVRQTIAEANENANYPIETLVYQLNIPFSENHFPLFDVVVLLENIHEKSYIQHIPNNMTFSFKRTDKYLEGTVDYNSFLYDKPTVQRITKHLKELLEGAIFNVDICISEINILTKEERKQILHDFNNNRASFDRSRSIYHFIELNSECIPDAVAVRCQEEEINYRQLNKRSNQLARVLRRNGIGKDQAVGILLERSPLMVIGIVAVWKARGAYIPLDPHDPVQRIMEILDDSGITVCLTASTYVQLELEQFYDGKMIKLDEGWEKIEKENGSHLDLEADMSGLAYVLYTSGSTGKPKGVMIEHIGMMNHIYAKISDLQLTNKSIAAQNASHTFDISVWQFFAALLLGGQTIIYSNETVLDPDRFIEQLIMDRVTILEVVPSYLSILLDSSALARETALPFEYLVVTGEEIKPYLVKRWFEKYPGIKMVNAYGPTEASDDITHYIMEKAPGMERVPIGKPIQNLNIYIVDQRMRLCPIGIKGEICVSGVGVGRGYLHNRKKTGEVFIKDPFVEEKGVRLYKTGDLGRWLPDGTIEFWGRKDHQVKIRGFRIELGEIESKLAAHAAVKEAVVIDKENKDSNKYLCAYLISANARRLNISDIKQYVMERLPDYMVPAHFIQLNQIPLTPNGKIDREALPEPVLDSHLPLPYFTEEMLKQVVLEPKTPHKTSYCPEEDESESRELSEEERNHLIYTLNDSKAEYPREKMLFQLFEEQVGKQKEHITIAYKDRKLTYSHVNKKANQLARRLRARGIKVDSIVGIMTEPSLELIIALLGVLKAGGSCMPIEPAYPGERIKFMLEDSYTRILLIQDHLIDKVTYKGEIIILNDLDIYQGETSNLTNLNIPVDVLHMLYTSGTTGKPKGVLISHENLVNYITWFSDSIRITLEDNTLLSSSFAYDLCYSTLYPSILSGGELHILSVEVYQDPESIINYIQNNKITFIKVTPSHYSIIINSPYFKSKVFRMIRFIVCGGEEINMKDVGKTHELYNHIEIMNHYGPSESTIGSITQFIDFNKFDAYKKKSIIGKPVFNTQAYILDRNLNLLPMGVVGELCISGDGISRGYCNRPELTAEKFVVNPFQPGKKMYLTGDFSRLLPAGTIEFLGRMDHQVKIKGYRIELSEIENHLLEINEIKKAVVIVREYSSGDKYFCAFVVSDKILIKSEVKEHLVRKLPFYMIPSYFVQLEKIPLTPNGKVDRRILRAVNINTEVGYEAPRDELEDKLAEIWENVLGVEKNKISINVNFFELGGHSLKVVILIAKIHKELNIKVPMAKVFGSPTIRLLSEYIKELKKDKFVPIEVVEEKEYYKLSSPQKRLYVLQQMDPDGTSYNIPRAVVLEGELDRKKLTETFKKLIKRHESLRTSFEMVGDEPLQRIHNYEDVGFEIELYDYPQASHLLTHRRFSQEENFEIATRSSQSVTSIIENFVRPFDLFQAPLLWVGLIKEETGKHILMVDMHHIITDGTSMGLLVNEFMSLYAGELLPPLRLQYKDYAEWQNNERQRKTIKHQEEYWLKQFEGEIPILNLPTDYPRPPVQSFEGRTLVFELSAKKTRALYDLALNSGTTLYMVLLGIYNVLLSKISGQEDIVVGTPIAARRHIDLERIIGMFVNTLAIRHYPNSEKSFKEFLKEVKERTLEAFENQEYQFEDLVEGVLVNRDASRNPLFDVVLAVPNMVSQTKDIPTIRTSELKAKPYKYENRTAKFDISLTCIEKRDTLVFTFEYCAKLFKKETIERFISFFQNSISLIPGNPGKKISEIEIISEEEKKKILYDFNNTGSEYLKNKTIHELFEEQVEKKPDHTALIGVGTRFIASDSRKQRMHVTYRELNQRSHQLAHLMQVKGVQPDTIVGIIGERSIEIIIGLLGILKAGCAYLPIDPDYPEERIRYMLTDGGADLLVAAHTLSKKVQRLRRWEGNKNFQIVLLEFSTFPSFHSSTLLPFYPSQSSNLAYVIYTSGTTGRPKGVMVQHSNFINAAFAWRKEYKLDEIEVNLLQMANFSFDVFGGDLARALINGGKMVICPAEVRVDSLLLYNLIRKQRITLFESTPSLVIPFMEYVYENRLKIDNLMLLIVGSDTFRVEDYKILVSRFGNWMRIINSYGVTEATIDSSYYEAKTGNISIPGSGNVLIGKPMPNIEFYILDSHKKLLPVGVIGELYIGGTGVARGYLNRPELTADKFIISSITGYPIRLYKTGDLAWWCPDGNIQFLGRTDYQVKIRGFRIELGELENQVLKHPGIKEAAVIDRESQTGEKYLCAYIVETGAGKETPGKTPIDADLKEYLSQILPDYMIPACFVVMEKIPLTTNGKINRKALPEPEIKFGEEYIAPGNEVEEKLTEIWSEVLGIEKNLISIDANFFRLGGHSLKAIIMIAKIHKELDAKLPLAMVFKTPSIRELSESIRGLVKEKYVPLEPAEKKEFYPLSSAQKRLYVLQQMDLESTAYNMPDIIPLDETIEIEKLEETFGKVLARHDSLRTSFENLDGEPVQKVHDGVEFAIEYYGFKSPVPESRLTSIIKNFVRPFDLSQVPLLRVGLIKIEEKRYLLLLDMNHIIMDGVSQEVLAKEFMVLYAYGEEGKALPGMKLQYKDFSEWQNVTREQQQAVLGKQEVFWMRHFRGEIPVLNLPCDYARPTIQRFDGSTADFSIDKEETLKLKELAAAEEVTPFMILMALFNVLLAKITSQEDIVVGTGVAGRRHEDLQHAVGLFVNTLAIRNYPTAEKTFKEFLQEVKERTLDAFENQDYPFENLVEKVVVKRDTSRNPLFDVMLMMQNMEIQIMETPGTALSSISKPGPSSAPDFNIDPYAYHNRVSKFDLTLFGKEVNDTLNFLVEYSTALFKRETIDVFITYFKEITFYAAANPGKKLLEIEKMPKQRREAILDRLNLQMKQELDKIAGQTNTLQDRLNESFKRFSRSSAPAIEYNGKTITYAQLDRKTNIIANCLIKNEIQKETFIGVLMSHRVSLILTMIGILKARCVFVPLDPDYPKTRLEVIINSSGITFIAADRVNFNSLGEDVFKQQEVKWLLIDEWLTLAEEEHFEQIPPPHIRYRPDDKIYVYFTSGSTGTPKAIVGKNSSLLHFIDWEIDTFGVDETFRVSQLIYPGFDAFLRDIFVPLCSGGMIIVPPGKDILLESDQLIKWIEQSGSHLIHCVPGLFRSVNPDTLTQYNFKSLKYILFSGEKLELSDLVDWYNVLGERIKYVNLYGPTETTLIKTYHVIGKKDLKRERISVGMPIRGSQVMILDNNMNLCDQLVTGEIYIRTPYMTYGYYNNPDLNRERFLKDPFNPACGDIIYKTGDIGRILTDGTIELLGRNDRQVKIRGIRVELEEIESVLIQHPLVWEAAVVKTKISTNKNKYKDNELLCGFITGKPTGKTSGSTTRITSDEGLISTLMGYLSEKLPGYMVPAKLSKIESMPRKPNGKIDYDALLDLMEIDKTYLSPPRDGVEEKILELWTDILGKGIENAGVTRSFFELGGNSLNTMVLISKIHREFDIRVPLGEIFNNPTIEKQAAVVMKMKARNHDELYESIGSVEKKEYYALSSAQKRLYFLQQMEENSIGYNISQKVILEEEIEKRKLEEVFRKLLQRHESLRTSFEMIAGKLVQRIHGHVEFEIEYNDSFIRPFDLSKAPLLRAGLIKQEVTKHVLIVDMHHIITDGISQDILTQEFMALYSGEELAPLRIQYKDFSEWQSKLFEAERIKKQEAYWLKEFEAEIPVLNIPTDYARPVIKRFEGSTIRFEIGREEVKSLKKCALEEGATLYMVLLAVTYVLLSRLSSQEDIVIGTPVAGRRHVDLERIIGMFVNTLALRNYPTADKTFKEFMKEVRKRALEVFENQEYPFEDLVNRVAVNRDTSRNPLFDVMFAFQNFDDSFAQTFEGEKFAWKIPALGRQPVNGYENITQTVKFDMTLNVSETGEGLVLFLEYSTKLFKKETIERFIAYFKKIISVVVVNTEVTLSGIEIISEEEKNRILFDFSDTTVNYPKDKVIHQLFEQQVEKSPDNISVTGLYQEAKQCVRPNTGRQHLTYRELNEKSNQLAHLLRAKGIGPDSIVGIMVNPSIEMIVGIFAILKSGGAYLPIDLEIPKVRKKFIIEDSKTKMLLTHKYLAEKNKEVLNIFSSKNILFFDDENIYEGKTIKNANDLQSDSKPGNLAYILYTSGSTGMPKGVMIEHCNVNNLVFGLKERVYHHYNTSLRVCLLSPYAFDASVKQIFAALFQGHCLYIVPEDARKDAVELLKFYLKYNIDVSDGTSAHIKLLVESMKESSLQLNVKHFLIGGESLPKKVVEEFFSRSKKKFQKITNVYGPTECCVDATSYEISELSISLYNSIPLGRPLPNFRVYIVDKEKNPQPVGVPGELCIGGAGVGRGYLNSIDVSREKFIENPFVQGEKMYLTGDIARWLPDGKLDFIGRIDNQVKIRGFRIELEEIENRLSGHKDIKEAVVISRSDETGNKYLCAYIVPDSVTMFEKTLDTAELREHLLNMLPGYMIPSYFTQIEKIPLTANGKLDRKALPEPEVGLTGEGYVPPGNKVEEKLAEIWQEVLDVKRIGINDNFFEVGGDSIKAIQISARLRKYNLELKISDLLLNSQIKELAKCVKEIERKIDQGIVEGEVPLTPIQRRFFNIDFTAKNHFNQAVMLHREVGFDQEILEKVVTKIVEHHDALRMVYEVEGGTVVQRNRGVRGIEGELFDFEIIHFEDRNLSEDEIGKEIEKGANRIQSGIDLITGPLVKIGLFKTSGGDNLLMVIHHLVVDGLSWRILLEDLITGYKQLEQGKEIELQEKTDPFQYWSQKLNEYAAGTAGAESKKFLRELKYWQEIETQKIEPLPRDFELGLEKKKNKYTETVFMNLNKKETGNLLKKVNHAYNTEINDILLTALGMAIKQWGGLEKVLINLEGHGRESIIEGIDITRTVGWFTTQYPVVLDMNQTDNLSYAIKFVKETLRRIPNKGIGYGILRYLTPASKKEGFRFEREPEISFNYLGQFGYEGNTQHGKENRAEFIKMSGMSTGQNVSLESERWYAVDINGILIDGRLRFSFTFNKYEYKRNTIKKLVDCYRENLLNIIDHCSKKKKQECTPSDLGYSGLSIKELEEYENEFSDIYLWEKSGKGEFNGCRE